MARSALRLGSKRPSAFTQADIRRTLKAARDAGEIPGRIVVTREGFAIELGAGHSTPTVATIASPEEDAAAAADEAALLREIAERTAAKRMTGKVA
jgi:hypothetical protein